jgi:hypothetical protein
MNEFDKYIHYLTIDCSRIKKHNIVTEISQKYNKTKIELIKKNTLECFQKMLNKQKKIYQKKYKHHCSEKKKGQNIQYVRYNNYFIIGIIGPHILVLKTKEKIDRFLKSDLHLKIKQNILMKQNEKNINFLNFLINIPKFYRGGKKKWNQIFKIVKYQKKKLSNFCITKNTVYSIKKDILKAFFNKSKNRKWNLQNFIILSEIILKITTKNKNNCHTTKNGHYFKKLFTKSFFTSSRFYSRCIHKIFTTTNNNSLAMYRIRNIKDNLILGLQKIVKHEQIINGKNLQQKVKINKLENCLFTKKNINIRIPFQTMWNNFSGKGFLHCTKNQPIANKFLGFFSDSIIIQNYSIIMYGLLYFYRPANNY